MFVGLPCHVADGHYNTFFYGYEVPLCLWDCPVSMFFYGNESPLCLWDCPVSRLDGWFGKEEMGRAAWVYLTPMARRWVDTLHTLWIHVLHTYMYLSFGLPALIFHTIPGSLACWLACFHKHTHTTPWCLTPWVGWTV